MRNSTDNNTPNKRMKERRHGKAKSLGLPYAKPFVYEAPSNIPFTLNPQSPVPMDLTADENERASPTTQSKQFSNKQRLQIIDRHKSADYTM